MMLDSYLTRLGIDTQMYSPVLGSGMINGRLYMVPQNLGQQVLIYKDAPEEAIYSWWGPIRQSWGGTWVNTVEKKIFFVSDENVMKGFSEMFDACTKDRMQDTAIHIPVISDSTIKD